MLKILDIFILTIFYLISFISIFYAVKLNSKKAFFVVILVFVLSVFFAFRSIGLDLEPYREIFNSFDTNRVLQDGVLTVVTGRIEPLFALLISFLKTIGLGFEFFLLISALIPSLVVLRVLQLETGKNFFVAFSFFMFIYFLQGPVDTIRGFAAASFYLYALSSLSRGESFKFLIKGLIAISLHYSSLIIFFIAPLLKIKWHLKSYIFLSLSVIIFGFALSNYLNNIDLTEFSSWHPLTFKIVYYLTYYQTEGYQYLNTAHFIFWWLLGLSFSMLIVFNTLHLLILPRTGFSKFNKIILNSQIIGTLLFFLFMSLGAYTMGGRILFLLAIGSFILIADVVADSGKPNKYLFVYMFLVFIKIFISFSYLAGFFDPKSPFNLFG